MKSIRLNRLAAWILIFVCAIAFSPSLRAQSSKPLPIMPEPAHFVRGQGQFLIDGSFNLRFEGYSEPRLERARKRFLMTLSRETGIPIYHEAQLHPATFVVQTKGPSDPVQQLGENESYHLEITPTQVLLQAPNPLGVLHGLQTFLQLVRITPQGFSVPAVTIDDQPRFAWRGLLIDVSRHFIPISMLKRELNGMEAVKLSVLHLHLSDDQGFRMESRKFPLLTKDGSDGLYYTQEEMKELIAYARDRGIRIVPEFDMPCHTASWMVGYPQLSSAQAPHHIARTYGIQNAAMDPTKESTYKFIDEFVGEMTGLFPDQYFHVGGDECNGKEWNANPHIQQWMREHHIANNAALQVHFTDRVEKIVAKHHKIMVGWDEVLQPETPKNVVIQSWRRDSSSLVRAARQGNRGIYSAPYYLNRNWSASKYYLADPFGNTPSELTSKEKASIVGGEAAMWTEYADAGNIDTRIWPNLAAVAERFWSPENVRDVPSMYRRLAVVLQKLKYYGIDPRMTTETMLERISGDPNPASLRVLAAVVEPTTDTLDDKETIFTPLNRLVNAVPAESMTAREFRIVADRIAAGTASPQDWQKARTWLTLWRDNDAKLEPTLAQSSLTKDLGPLSQSLSRVAAIGLQAMDDLKNGRSIDAQTRQQDLDFLKSAKELKPLTDSSVVPVDAVAPSVELLVNATKTQ